MENVPLYIKYANNQPVKVQTHIDTLRKCREFPLTDVGDLIAAVKIALPAKLSSIDTDELTLHLPEGVDRSALSVDCFSRVDSKDTTLDPGTLLSTLGSLGLNSKKPLIIKSGNDAVGVHTFLSNILADIPKDLGKPTTTGTKRSHPKTPKNVGRWEDFIIEAARYEYPTTPIGADVILPTTTEIKFKLETDVDFVIKSHLAIFNRIFRDQGKVCRFESKVGVSPSTLGVEPQENQLKFIGVPDNVLTLDSKVLSFVEDKTPNDLPVCDHRDGHPFDLLEIYQEDINYTPTGRIRGDIGRTDVCTVIDQVYGYMALNNLIYGCVTCYDVTYFLWRPTRGTLLISHPIFNYSRDPSLLQALYYFVQLVLKGHDENLQTLTASPKGSDLSVNNTSTKERDAGEDLTKVRDAGEAFSEEYSDFGSYHSRSGLRSESKRRKFDFNLDSLHSGTCVGSGATGQVILLKNSNIVVKTCDSYNNPDGFEMFKNEISVYEKLSQLNLEYVPRYYGECELYGQYFIALEFIPGKHCDWRNNIELSEKLDFVLRDLKTHGVVHQDLRPENVLLTPGGHIKLIDFGKADIQ